MSHKSNTLGRVLVWSASLLLVISLIALIYSLSSGVSPLRYAYTTAIVDALPVVAQESGLWTSDSTHIDGLLFTTGRETVEALLSGAADFATMAEWPFLLAVQRNPELRVLATIATGNTMGLVANRRAGISDLSDLSGKRIGASAGTTGQFYLESLLTKAGVPISSVDIISLKPAELVAAFQSNALDAISTWEPFVTRAATSSSDNVSAFIFEEARKEFRVQIVVATTQKLLETQRESAVFLLRSLIRAEDWIAKNPEAFISLLSRHTNLDDAHTRDLLPLFEFSVKLSEDLEQLWEKQFTWAQRVDSLSGHVSALRSDAWIAADVLRAIDSSRIKDITP